ncbi:MAG: lysophospholipid acyltransferase family protein [Planctomycetota bacterium]|nr:lysophospholipid acyltransferase family protein [Planctomycetota bacterium]MDW8372058.1 lysophospholipid acyltransferase family protein [Planctomycetota bacterium]
MRRWLTRWACALLRRLAADTACRVGAALGVLAWRCGLRRRIVQRQLSACLGVRGPERAALARRAYAHIGAQFLQVWTIGGASGPERAVRVLNPRWMALLARRWPSAVVITAHLGDWDLGAHALTRAWREVLVYAKPLHDAALDAELNARRAAAGLRLVFVAAGERVGAIEALRALRRGAALGMLADQRPHHGVRARFLGFETLCFDGPAFFARKAGVPIIPGCCLRRRAGESVVVLGRPLAPDADHQALVQRCMDALSALILAHPGQYFWHHRRFPERC